MVEKMVGNSNIGHVLINRDNFELFYVTTAEERLKRLEKMLGKMCCKQQKTTNPSTTPSYCTFATEKKLILFG